MLVLALNTGETNKETSAMKGWMKQVAVVTAMMTAGALAAWGQSTAQTPQEGGGQAAAGSEQQQQQQQQQPQPEPQQEGTTSAQEAANETMAPTPFMNGPSAFIGFGAGFTLSDQITTTGGVLPQYASRTGEAQIGVRDQIGDLAALELRFGIMNNGQTFGTLSYVDTRIAEYSGDLALTLPPKGILRLYFLGGPSLLQFMVASNGNNSSSATSQVKFGANYGGGIDIKVRKNVALQLEYRGIFYKTPDFNVTNATFSAWSHIAIPDVSLLYHF